MLLFYFKKNFCDGWDNMFLLLLANVISLALCTLTFFGVSITLATNPLLGIIILVAGICIITTSIFAFGGISAKIADFKPVSVKAYFSEYKKAALWKDGLLFGLLAALMVIITVLGIPFYLNMDAYFGPLLAALLFWLLFVCLVSLQWFLPIRSLMNNSFGKCLKKCFIVFFDNVGFSIAVFLYTFLMLILSFFVFFILPGFSGIVLAHMNAMRLRLYKYDWLEEHPEIANTKARKNVPWETLIAKDKETLGPRGFKSFIFPWKQ